MATGYTASIYDGKNVGGKEFIATCASAFGVYVTKRDEALGSDLPTLEPNVYHLNALKKARNELENLKFIDQEEIKKQIDEERQISLQRARERFNENNALKLRYEETLKDVENWIPPTSEHMELKNFCIQQLKDSIAFDCSDADEFKQSDEKEITPAEWLYEKGSRIAENVKYHQKEYRLEVERTNNRNIWISELRQSLSHM